MNPHLFATRRARRFQVAVAMLAASLLVLLFLQTRPVDMARHNGLMNQLASLQSNDARLGEAVLQLNFSLANNYDAVTAIMQQMRATVRDLQHGELARQLREEAGFRAQIELAGRGLETKGEALEAFKSRNAVLKNSLVYLRRARDELLSGLPPGTAAHETLDDLVELVLLNRLQGVAVDSAEIESKMGELQQVRPGMSADTRARLEGVLRHIRQIDRHEKEIPALVRQLRSRGEFAGLQDAYNRQFEAQQARTTASRMFLLLLTLGLIVYAVQALLRLREQSERLRLAASVFATASEGITITDLDGRILDVNSAFTALTGYSRAEVIGKNPRMLQSGRHSPQFYAAMWQSIRESGMWQGEVWNRRKSGEVFPEWLTITAATTQAGLRDEVSHYVATFSDITERKKSEAEIFQLAFFDPLTGLPNRRQIMDRLDKVRASAASDRGRAALLFIDVDNFKTLNDVKGHDAGDLLLIEIARRLEATTREYDLVGRLSGDEFVVVLERLSGEASAIAAQAGAAAAKIHEALQQPYRLRDYLHRSSCSIGISLFNEAYSVDELLRYADTAMYQAKAAGRNAVCFFDPAMQAALELHAALETDLRQAVEQRQFELYYQVQCDTSGRAVGAEALIRWNHPHQGLLAPGAFIALAEESELILQIGAWVLAQACAQLKAWAAHEATRDLVLAVNVSARQFASDELIAQIETLLQSTGIVPSRLKLEITESMLLKDVEKVISTLRQLKGLGLSFSIDDFGTGYSSLQYLKRLPLDQIKIDQSFVRDITIDQSDQAIVRTIVAMAQALQLQTIAEGVETAEQQATLVACGCQLFQGYHLSRPVPLAAFEDRLARFAAPETRALSEA